MNVMYAFDENYAEIAAVSILSLLKHAKQFIHLYLIEENVTEESKTKLRNMIVSYDAEVDFIPKPDMHSLIGFDLGATARWSDSTYSRLFIKELFGGKPEVDKVLHIDSDSIVVDDLSELYDTDISDYLGAACYEAMGDLHKTVVGGEKENGYINNGVLLINVRKWIQEDIQGKVIEYLHKSKGKQEYVDQGVLNGLVGDRFRFVSPRYNLTCLAFDMTYEEMQIYRKPSVGYTKEEWQAAIDSPAIIHFTTSFLSIRPWFEGSSHPYAKEWKLFHDETPWKDCPYRVMRDRKKKERKLKMFRMLPRKLAIHIAGFLHSYIKPLLFMVAIRDI